MSKADAVKAAASECIREGILAEYLENNASEVINMLAQEWDWDKAMEINARDAAREAEMRVREHWQAVVTSEDAEIAGKDAEIAGKDAEITALKAMLEEAAAKRTGRA